MHIREKTCKNSFIRFVEIIPKYHQKLQMPEREGHDYQQKLTEGFQQLGKKSEVWGRLEKFFVRNFKKSYQAGDLHVSEEVGSRSNTSEENKNARDQPIKSKGNPQRLDSNVAYGER